MTWPGQTKLARQGVNIDSSSQLCMSADFCTLCTFYIVLWWTVLTLLHVLYPSTCGLYSKRKSQSPKLENTASISQPQSLVTAQNLGQAMQKPSLVLSSMIVLSALLHLNVGPVNNLNGGWPSCLPSSTSNACLNFPMILYP